MGNPDISRISIETSQENRDAVYQAIHNLMIFNPKKKGVMLSQIKNDLEKRTQWENEQVEKETRRVFQKLHEDGSKSWTPNDLEKALRKAKKKTITIRTIQNCIKKDPRIKKDGWFFYIDHDAMFEKRYLSPTEFGGNMYEAIFRSTPEDWNRPKGEPEYLILRRQIIKLGVFLVYSFIEAARPFKDQSMNSAERQELVYYWVQNAVPLDRMFRNMTRMFDRLGRSKSGYKQKIKRKMASEELDEESTKKGFETLQQAYPELYKILEEASRENGYIVVPKNGNMWRHHFVRGKSYHTEVPLAEGYEA